MTTREETMTEELEQLLRNLHLRRILEIYDDHLDQKVNPRHH